MGVYSLTGMDDSMYKSLKNTYISVVLSTIIILLNTDLSCLKTYLMAVHSTVKTREFNEVYKEMKYSVVLPNQAVLTVKDNVYKHMATRVVIQVTESATVRKPSVSFDTSCRGSPLTGVPN